MKSGRIFLFVAFLIVTLAAAGCAPAPAPQAPAATQAPPPTQAPAAAVPNLVKPGVLIAADTGKAPPNTMVGDNGQPVGAWVDLMQTFADKLGLKLEIVYLDWPGVLPGLQAGKFDVVASGLRRTPERLASKDFIVTDAFNAEGVLLMVKKDSGITSWEDMKGKKLGIIRGEHEGEIAVEKVGNIVAETLEYPGKQEGMLEVLNGRIDGFAAGGSGMAYQLNTAPQGDQLTLVGPALDIRDQGMAVRKEAPELAAKLNELIAAGLADGSIHKIYAKWYGTPNPVDVLAELKANPASAAPPPPTATPKPEAKAKPEFAADALQTAGEIHLAADFGAPPNQFIDEAGQMQGINPDLCNAMVEKLGLKVKWTNLAFPGLIPGLQAKRFDALCTGVFVNPDRLKIMNMVPYVRWGEGLLVKAGNPEGIKCTPTPGDNASYDACFATLQGKPVSVAIAGTTEKHLREYNEKFKAAGQPEIILRGFDSNAEAFQALVNGQVVGTYLNDPQAYFFADKNPGQYEVAFEGYSPNQLALTTLLENPTLATNFQWALEQMKADGTYDKILEKWGVMPVASFELAK